MKHNKKDWHKKFSEKYFDKIINYQDSESVFKSGKFYSLNTEYVEKLTDFFPIEVYNEHHHNPNFITNTDEPTITIKFFVVFNKANSADNLEKDSYFLCIESVLASHGELELSKGKEKKIFDRIWFTKFIFNNQILIFRWYENPNILKDYYNNKNKNEIKFGMSQLNSLMKVELKHYPGCKFFKEIKI